MSTTAYERVLDRFRAEGLAVNERGDRASAQAPGHSPADRSVSIMRIPGQVLVHCHSDDTKDVLDRLELTMADLFDSPRGPRYDYPDGRRVSRTPDKKFRQSGNTKGRALFGVDHLDPEGVVYVVEGEKDVLAARAAGGSAVCSAMGAGKARLADWTPLRGREVVIVADKDEPGRKHAAQVSEILDGIAAQVVVAEALTGKDMADHIAAGHTLAELVPIEAPQPRPSLSVITLADVQPTRLSWLWPGYLPLGKLVTLDGDPSLGKSTLALEFAAHITTGSPWPDGSPCSHPGDVVLLSAEDGLDDTVRPRADAAGADVHRIHAIQGVALDDGTLVPPTLADIAALTDTVRRYKAKLLVVDVLMAYMPSGTDSHKDQDIRRVLSKLSAMADREQCTVLLLRHLNKAKGGDPMYRGGGSIGIVGAARAGLLVAKDPDDESGVTRVLASVKSNLSAPPASLTYHLADAGMGVASIEWTGVDERDARALLATPDESDDGDRNAAADWLHDYLTETTQPEASEVKKAAAKAGLSERTVKRAAKKLGVKYSYVGFPRRSVWSLPVGPTGPTGPTGSDLHKRSQDSGQITQSGATGGPTVETPFELHKQADFSQSGQSGQSNGPQPGWQTCRVCATGPMTVAEDRAAGVHAGCLSESPDAEGVAS